MRICIPTIDDQGPDGLPSAHFGASPYFTFFDLDTGDWEALPNQKSVHEHGACRPLDLLTGRPLDAVLCGGLGNGAYARLRSQGVRVYLSHEPDVRSCLEAFREGRLREMTEAEVCSGHQHHHGDGQGHGHAHGHAHGHGPGHGHGFGGGQGTGRGRGRGQ